MTIGIFKNGRADWFYKCTDIEVTNDFIRFKKNNSKDILCFFFRNIEGYAIEEVQDMEIIIAFGCGCAFIILPLIAASVSDAVQRKKKRNEILKNFGIKP